MPTVNDNGEQPEATKGPMTPRQTQLKKNK